jgi:NAD(P)-dependent dehydrogenase (short-subunit alcohol dehydrogenase family)
MVSAEFNLNGKKALVAGDSRFWAKYAAAALAEAGADVAIAARNPQKLQAAAGEVQRLGRKAITVATDVTKAYQVQAAVDRVVNEFGKIDILVNAADLQFAKPFAEIKKEEWQKVMDANLTSVFLCSQTVGREMLKQKKGRIISIASGLAERGLANTTAYCAAMGGVLQLTRALALEWAREGITVNAIGVGWMAETERTGAWQEEQLLRYLPTKRYGHPKEIGSLLVYLASDATDFVSGQFMYVDGAIMAHL